MATSPPTSPVDCPQKDLLASLSALHFGGKYADLTILCGYRRWECHRAILCSRSGFFDGACGNAFSESTSRVIDLSEDPEDAVNQMIYFFYHLDYDCANQEPPATVFRHRAEIERRKQPNKLNLSLICDPLLAAAGCYTPESPVSPAMSPSDGRGSLDLPEGKGPRSPTKTRARTPPLVADGESDYESCDDDDDDEDELEDESHLLLHTRVYALAEKYDIPSLKQLALRKFEMAMACNYDSSELPAAIEEVYASTIDSDRGLRNIVCEAFRCHPQLASTPDVLAVIQDLPSLALDLFKLERGIPVALLGGD